MNSFTIKNIYKFLIVLFIAAPPLLAQELSLGADIVNRYIWRGTDFGNSPHIQPTIEFGAGGFAAGFWGSYPTSTSGETVGESTTFHAGHSEEIDLYLSYGFDLGNSGGLSFGVTDYMFPTAGFEITNFENDGAGSHFIEVTAAYSGPDNFPISVAFNAFVHNVPDNPIYFEIGYSTAIEDIGFDIFIGGTAGDGTYYYGSTETFDIVNTGITASKEIKFSDSFSLPIFGSIIVNPATENLFYVVGVSL